MTDEDIISGIISREGSRYTNDPVDRQGPTRWGITLATLRQYHHDDAVTAEEIMALTEHEAREIYRSMYVERPGFTQIKSDNLRAFMVDWGVNSGPRTPIKAAQKRLGITPDGILGPLTAYKINAAIAHSLYDALINDRADFYHAIVVNDPSQQRFINGWMARNNEFRGVSWA